MKDYYHILGLSPNVQLDQIKTAYRQLVQKYHPDHNPEHIVEAEMKFKEIKEAYDILSDPQKRQEYHRQYMASTANRGMLHGNAGSQNAEDIIPSLLRNAPSHRQTSHTGKPHTQASHTHQTYTASSYSQQAYTQKTAQPQQNDMTSHIECILNLKQALLGTTLQLPTPQGIVCLNIPPGTQPGSIFHILNHGVQQGNKIGDYIVKIQVHIPELLSPRQKQLFESFWGEGIA